MKRVLPPPGRDSLNTESRFVNDSTSLFFVFFFLSFIYDRKKPSEVRDPLDGFTFFFEKKIKTWKTCGEDAHLFWFLSLPSTAFSPGAGVSQEGFPVLL